MLQEEPEFHQVRFQSPSHVLFPQLSSRGSSLRVLTLKPTSCSQGEPLLTLLTQLAPVFMSQHNPHLSSTAGSPPANRMDCPRQTLATCCKQRFDLESITVLHWVFQQKELL